MIHRDDNLFLQSKIRDENLPILDLESRERSHSSCQIQATTILLQKKNYYGITAHFLNENFVLKSFVLDVSPILWKAHINQKILPH